LIDSLNCNVSTNYTTFTAVFKKIPEPPDGPDIHFSLYPNPASSALILQHDNKTLAKDCVYEIFDLNGRIITQGDLNTNTLQTPIDISSLRASMYLIRIKKAVSTVETLRFVKE